MKLLDRFLYSKLWWIILRRITRGSEYEHAVPADYEEIRREKERRLRIGRCKMKVVVKAVQVMTALLLSWVFFVVLFSLTEV